MAPNSAVRKTSTNGDPSASFPGPKTGDRSEFWVKSPYPDIKIRTDVEMQEVMLQAISTYAELPALTCAVSGKTLTYNEVFAQSRAFGSALIQAGYQKGEIAGIILPNCVEFPVVLFGCWIAGLTVVCLNPVSKFAEILTQLDTAKPQLLIPAQDNCHLDTLLNLERHKACIRDIIVIGEIDRQNESYTSFTDFIQNVPPNVTPARKNDANKDTTESIAWLPFSSGTTGPQKMVIFSHGHMTTNLEQFIQEDVVPTKSYHETGKQERLVALLPFFHGYGMFYVLMVGLYQGSHLVCLPRFKADLFLKVVREHKPTCLHLVTPIITHIVNSPEFTRSDFESVHTVVGNAAPIGKALINRFLARVEHPVFFQELYAMTEMFVINVLNPSTKNRKIGSCGRPAPSNICKVVNPLTGFPQGPNDPGEILVKGPLLAQGYLHNAQATHNLIDSEGWIHTGDVGYYDEDGFFYVVDRIKELIQVKSFQVAPSELEDLLRKHPKVADCAVIGIPSETHGQLPRAYIVPHPGTDISTLEIHDYLEPLISTFKKLKGGIQFVVEIPKSPSGKILRRQLAADYSIQTFTAE